MSTEKQNKVETPLNQNGNGFKLWEFHLLNILAAESLMKELTANEKDTLIKAGKSPVEIPDSAKAKRIITMNCSNDLVVMLLNLSTAQDIWDFLYNKFSGKKQNRKNAGIKHIATYKFTRSSMSDNLTAIQNILSATQIAAGSETIGLEDLAVTMFLNSLPDKYSAVRTVLENQTGTLKLSQIATSLSAEEEKMTARAKPTGFAGHVDQAKKCIHNRSPLSCWTCDPALHPSRSKCKDCNSLGHKSKASPKCKLKL